MLLRLRHQLDLLALFLMGAAIPLVGILLLLASGLLMFGSITGLVVGAFLLSNGLYGLWVSFKSFRRPQGRKLNAENAPELLERLDELARAWKGPRRVDVVLDPGFWALDLVGVPTLGLLGWPRFTWLMGLHPLLALGEREFEVLASWELIWWCDQQGWLNLQVKRLAAYWSRLANELQEPQTMKGAFKDRWSRAFLRPFARWAKRRFEPFLLRELLNTDRAVANHFGKGTLARALCRQAMLKPLLDCRVFARWDRALKVGEPLPDTPISEIMEMLSRWPEEAEGLLQLALDGFAPEAPPLLKLRLEQLEEVPTVPLPRTAPAVRLMEHGSVLQDVDRKWRQRISNLEAESQRTRAGMARRFHDLRSVLAVGFPHHPEARTYLELALESKEVDSSEQVQLAATYQEAHPGAEGRLFLIRAKLADGQDVGPNIEELLKAHPFVESSVHELLEAHERKANQLAKAEQEWIQVRRLETIEARARQERRSVSLRDELEPHGMSETVLEILRTELEAHAQVREAFLVRKHVEWLPHSPLLFLVVRWRAPFWDPRGAKRSAFQTQLARSCSFPAGCAAFVLVTTRGHLRWKRRKLQRLHARFYAR